MLIVRIKKLKNYELQTTNRFAKKVLKPLEYRFMADKIEQGNEYLWFDFGKFNSIKQTIGFADDEIEEIHMGNLFDWYDQKQVDLINKFAQDELQDKNDRSNSQGQGGQ